MILQSLLFLFSFFLTPPLPFLFFFLFHMATLSQLSEIQVRNRPVKAEPSDATVASWPSGFSFSTFHRHCFTRRLPVFERMCSVSTLTTTSTHTHKGASGGRRVVIFKFAAQICHESWARRWPCGRTIEANRMNMTQSLGKVPGIVLNCN